MRYRERLREIKLKGCEGTGVSKCVEGHSRNAKEKSVSDTMYSPIVSLSHIFDYY